MAKLGDTGKLKDSGDSSTVFLPDAQGASSKQRKKVIVLVFGVLLAFGIGYKAGQQGVGLAIGRNSASFTNQYSTNQPADFSLFWQVYDTIQKDYYDKNKIDRQKVLYGAIQGMVASLGDPYTTFLTPDQNKEVQAQLNGTYEGVGIQLGYKDNKMVVVAPLDGTPAKLAGVRSGDLVLKIGDKVTSALSLDDAVSRIRGSAGTAIDLTLVHDGDANPYSVHLVRTKIQIKTATFVDKGNGVGYMKISQFAENTDSEWDQAVGEALKSGEKVIVLDVRDNPGGFLTSAVHVGSEFITNGSVVKQDEGGKVTDFTPDHAGRLLGVSVVVLINKGSASASEIVSGALQDTGRGTLVGDQSFGKGTIQAVDDVPCKPAPNSACPSLHITIAKWLTPKGRWIHGVGLTPDVKVSLTDSDFKVGSDPQLDKAIQLAITKEK
jgi:carboxyl-terminal processing protease